MVSGNGGACNTGTTPVYNIADPLKEVEIHPQERHLGSVFHQALVLLFCQEANPVVRQEPGQTGNSGQSGTSTATFRMPPRFLDSGFTGHGGPAQCVPTVTAVDPVIAQMLRQQMLLTQGVMDLLYRTEPGLPQQPVQQTLTVAQNSTGRLRG